MGRALDGQAHSPLAAAIDRREQTTVHGEATEDPDGPTYEASVLDPGRRRSRRAPHAARPGDRRRRRRAASDRGRRSRRARRAGSRRSAPVAYDDRARWRHAVGRLDEAQVVAAVGAARSARGRERDPGGRSCAAHARSRRRRARSSPDSCSATRAASRARSSTTTATPGLSHLLAVSGENVAFVMALAAPLLRRLRLGARTAAALAIVFVFAAMTRFEPSVLRASAMAAIALLATLGGRPASSLRVLAYAVDRAAARRSVPRALGRVRAVVRRERGHRVLRRARSAPGFPARVRARTARGLDRRAARRAARCCCGSSARSR